MTPKLFHLNSFPTPLPLPSAIAMSRGMSRIVSLLSFDDPPNFEAGFGRIGDIRGSSEVPGVNRGRVSPSDVDLKLKKICLQFYKGQMTGKNHERIQLSCFNFDVGS